MKQAAALAALFVARHDRRARSPTPSVNDLYLYNSVAELIASGRLPYLDFDFEYPPLAALPLWLANVPGGGEDGYAWAFGALMLACALALQRFTRRCSAARARRGCSCCCRSLLGATLRTHYDLLPAAIVAGALLLFARGRHHVGVRGARPRDGDEALPGAARAGRASCGSPGAARARRASAASPRSPRSWSSVSLPVPRRRLRRAGALPPRAAGADRVDAGVRALRARRLGRHRRPDPATTASSPTASTAARPTRSQLLFTAAARRVAARGIVALAARGARRRATSSCAASRRCSRSSRSGKVLSPQFMIWLAPFAAVLRGVADCGVPRCCARRRSC